MSKIFGKKKGKKKGNDGFRSFANVAQPLIPPAVFVATPRIAGCAFEPIILCPVDLSDREGLPDYQGAGNEYSPGTITSRRVVNVDDDEDMPAESASEDTYDMAARQAYVSAAQRGRPQVVGPPEGFRDSNDDTEPSFEDNSFSPSFRPSSTTIRDAPEEDAVVMATASLLASRNSEDPRSLGDSMVKSTVSDERSRHSSRSKSGDPRRMLRELSPRALEETVESQMIHSSMSHTNRSLTPQLRNSSVDLHKSITDLPETFQLRRSGERHLAVEHRLTGESLRSLPSVKSSGPDERVWGLQERIQDLENENQRMRERLNEQRDEISGFGMIREDREPLGNISSRKSREEVETLKNVVHRLNTELDIYHKKFRRLTPSELDEIASFPVRGPKPSWLVNTKYLAPLLLAYDDQLREKESVIETYENQLVTFQQKVDEILKENNRLHIRLEQTDAVGPISMTEWRQFQEQCKLVLEENQLLMEQLDIQQNKEKDVRKTLLQETSKLTQRAVLAETERAQMQQEVEDLRTKFSSLKQKYDDAVIDSCSKMNMEEHVDALSVLKQSAQDEKSRHAKELTETSAKIKAAEAEKEKLERDLENAETTIKDLETDIKNKVKAEKKYKKEIEYLQLTINDSEMLTAKVRQYLANVLKTAEVTAKERDTLAVSVQEQEKAKTAALKKLISESADMEKIKEKIKAYNFKKKEKLGRMANRLKEQDNDFNIQRQEYEREIKHLQQLVRDKDEIVNIIRGEKKVVLEDLETMWQAATRENQQMQETIRQTNRKLHDHVCLRTRMLDEPEPLNVLDQLLNQCGCDGES